jgi:hypothetical protein
MFALFNLGPVELLVLLLLVLVVWPLWRVCSRAGFPGPLALVAIIPLGLIVLLFVLAFAEWPALRRWPRQPEGNVSDRGRDDYPSDPADRPRDERFFER